MAMNEQERRAYMKKKIDVVVTRSTRTKVDAESKLTDYPAGTELTIAHEFADELISMNKAVVKGSPEHRAWVETQKIKQAAAKKADELAEAKAKIAELEAKLAKKEK